MSELHPIWIDNLSRARASTLVVFVDRRLRPAVGHNSSAALRSVLRQAKRDGYKGRRGEIFSHPGHGEKKWILIGVGPARQVTPEVIRRAAAGVRRALGRRKLAAAAFLPWFNKPEQAAAYGAAAYEGLAWADYSFGKYLSRRAAPPLRTLALVAPRQIPRSELQSALKQSRVLTKALVLARDLVNEQSSAKRPPQLAGEISRKARAAGVRCRVLGPRQIRDGGFAGLEGVARGSQAGPYLLHLTYRPKTGDKCAVALIGKGITFDSGGLNLKTGPHLRSMKSDMAGAAVALAALLAAAELRLPLRIEALLPLAENMPAEGAMRPGDILTMANGKSVEILDTDAEGRLILADALCYAQKLKVDQVVELSTLTGGCLYALGRYCAGFFCRDQRLSQELRAAARASGEMLWPLPLIDEYRRELRGRISDLRNIGRTQAGTITAAWFLQEFAGAIPFAHIDIAGPAFFEERPDIPYWDSGASGYGVRTLLAFLAAKAANR